MLKLGPIWPKNVITVQNFWLEKKSQHKLHWNNLKGFRIFFREFLSEIEIWATLLPRAKFNQNQNFDFKILWYVYKKYLKVTEDESFFYILSSSQFFLAKVFPSKKFNTFLCGCATTMIIVPIVIFYIWNFSLKKN